MFLGEEWGLFFFFPNMRLMFVAFGSRCQNPQYFSGVLVSLNSPTHLCFFCPQSPTFSTLMLE